jgi:hypothetical protein
LFIVSASAYAITNLGVAKAKAYERHLTIPHARRRQHRDRAKSIDPFVVTEKRYAPLKVRNCLIVFSTLAVSDRTSMVPRDYTSQQKR